MKTLENPDDRNIFDNILFFFIPGFVSLALYCMIGRILMKTRKQRMRNRNLTIAFLTACVFWIIFSLPRFLLLEHWALYIEKDLNRYRIQGWLYFIWFRTANLLYSSFSMLNPLIFLFISRKFQKPIRSLGRKVKHGVMGTKLLTSVPSTSGSTTETSSKKKSSEVRDKMK